MAAPKLTQEQQSNAALIYNTASSKYNLTPAQAYELVGASYAESGLRESSTNSKSGAFGLFQLLSTGYVNAYNSLVKKGESPEQANVDAILPAYQSSYKLSPGDLSTALSVRHLPAVDTSSGQGAVPELVEASGMPASWYASATHTVTNALDVSGGSAADWTSGGTGIATGAAGVVKTEVGLVANPVPTALDVFNKIGKHFGINVEGELQGYAVRGGEMLAGGVLVILGIIMIGRAAIPAAPAAQVGAAIGVAKGAIK